MPSLPELEVYRRQFAALIGQPITQVEPLDYRVVRATPAELDDLLVGHALTAIARYGKWLNFSTGAASQLLVHLGLTGHLDLLEPGAHQSRSAAWAITFATGRRLVMRDQRHLGRLYVRPWAALAAEKQLGPDLLALDEATFIATLSRKRRGARDVLMDQRVVAGIGGKYADEILWQARLHPNTKLDRLSPEELARLHQLARGITGQAIALGADVERFPADWLIPHRRTDRHCPRCGSELTGRKLGGSEAFYCPICQPAPNPYRRG